MEALNNEEVCRLIDDSNWEELDKLLFSKYKYERSKLFAAILEDDPSLLDELHVITMYMFSGAYVPDSIMVPASVKLVDTGAFSRTNVKSVSFAGANTLLDDGVFNACHKLTNVVLPSDLFEIKQNTFNDCQYLAEIEIPDSVEFIGPRAFSGCYSLSKVKLGSSVTNIGTVAFRDCVNLTELTLPPNIRVIGKGAFKGSGLQRLVIPEKFADPDLAARLLDWGISLDCEVETYD